MLRVEIHPIQVKTTSGALFCIRWLKSVFRNFSYALALIPCGASHPLVVGGLSAMSSLAGAKVDQRRWHCLRKGYASATTCTPAEMRPVAGMAPTDATHGRLPAVS